MMGKPRALVVGPQRSLLTQGWRVKRGLEGTLTVGTAHERMAPGTGDSLLPQVSVVALAARVVAVAA